MTSQKISNEMIYDLLKQQQGDIHGLKEGQHGLKEDVHNLKEDLQDFKQRYARIQKRGLSSFRSNRAKIRKNGRSISRSSDRYSMTLHKNKIKWNAGLIGGVVAMSSIASIILIRLLHMIGIKVVALSQIIFV